MSQPKEIPQLGIDVLTPRESEVAYLLTMGKCQKRIADMLHISIHTVRNTSVRVMRKLSANSSVDVARKVILSVENPRQFFLSWVCLVALSTSIFGNNPQDFRRARKRARTHKTFRNGNS